MQPLEQSDLFLLSAAQGWLELGNLVEARAELDQVSAAAQNHPVILEARWVLCAAEQNWVAALEIARTSLRLEPKNPGAWLNQAYALRRTPDGGLQAAWTALRPALDMFQDEATIPYNLSCYACQMNDLTEARTLLHRAIAVGGREPIKKMALHDADLKPLWDEIQKL